MDLKNPALVPDSFFFFNGVSDSVETMIGVDTPYTVRLLEGFDFSTFPEPKDGNFTIEYLEFEKFWSREPPCPSVSGIDPFHALIDDQEDDYQFTFYLLDDYPVTFSPSVSPLLRNWRKGEILGSGACGCVYGAISEDGKFFALKEVPLDDESSRGEQNIKNLEQEILLLSRLHHRNIVQYLGTARDDKKLYIFLELVTKGSLAKVYQNYDLQDSQVSAYTRQILSGLIYLHARNVVHRDIKCANILVDANGLVKLADFGLSKELTDTMSNKGTPYWMAPEVVKSNKDDGYGLAADIWSLGCTVLEMLTRKTPFCGLEPPQAIYKIAKGGLPEIPDTLSLDAKDFIRACLQADPNNRPTAAQLLSHPYVTRS